MYLDINIYLATYKSKSMYLEKEKNSILGRRGYLLN